MTKPPELFATQRYRRRRGRAHTGPGFLHQEIAARLIDRLDDIKRQWSTVLLLGGDDQTLIQALQNHSTIDRLIVLNDLDDERAAAVSSLEALPFKAQSVDAILSSTALHWVNDFPGCLKQLHDMLKPDGLLLIGMPGGETLHELRYALTQAEIAIKGGAAIRVPPFIDVRDAGSLLQRAGFALPVADIERLTIRYRSINRLFDDLRAMAETNPLCDAQHYLSMPVLLETLRIYADEYGMGGLTPASFDLLFMTGWRAHQNQQQPLRPGSAATRLVDALKPPSGHDNG